MRQNWFEKGVFCGLLLLLCAPVFAQPKSYSSSVADVRISALQTKEVARPYQLSNVTGLRWDQVVINGQAVMQEQVKVDQAEPKHHW